MSTHTMIAATALLALMVVPAGAQQHQHGQDEGTGMMSSCPMMQGMHGHMMGGMHGDTMQGMQGAMRDGGMMGMMGPMHMGPAMLLQASDDLELTAEQTERLAALRDRSGPEHQEHMQSAMAACRTAAAALEGDSPDLEAYAVALNETADHMVMVHVAMARVALEAREILTAEQREKLRNMMGTMHR